MGERPTYDDFAKIFGGWFPVEAVNLVLEAPDGTTVGQIRRQLEEMARTRKVEEARLAKAEEMVRGLCASLGAVADLPPHARLHFATAMVKFADWDKAPMAARVRELEEGLELAWQYGWEPAGALLKKQPQQGSE